MILNETTGMYVPSTILEHVNYVNEAYFGKTDNLIRLEKAIGELRQDYSFKRDYTATPEVKRIENIIKQQFGMDYFTLSIIPTRVQDAYTISIGTRFDIIKDDVLSKMVIADQKTGYHYKKNNGFLIIVALSGGILVDQNFTNAEIAAIILHEIGHNFSAAISNNIKVANYEWYEAIMAEAALSASSKIYDILDYNTNEVQAKLKQEEKPSTKVQSFFKYVGGKLSDFGFNFKLFAASLFAGFIGMSIGQQTINNQSKSSPDEFKKDPARQDEIIADKFAAIYGYGTEQATVLAKLSLKTYPSQEFLSKIPFGNMVLKYTQELTKDSFKHDCHPHLIQRANTMIESLKFELSKKNLDPEMRKIIEKQIKEMEDCKKEFMKVRDDDNEIAKVERVYAAVVEKKFPEATTEKLEKEINKQIDDLCNKKYK